MAAASEEEDSFAKRVDRAFGSLGVCAGDGAGAANAIALSASPTIPPTWRICEEHAREPRQEEVRSSLVLRSEAEKEGEEEEERGGENDEDEDEDEDEEEEDDDDDESLQSPSASTCWGFRFSGRTQGSDRMETCEEKEGEEEEEEDLEEEGRQMRGMIGLDCTLDFEDEEDEFDKAAIGREIAGEEGRVYMREIIDVKNRSMAASSDSSLHVSRAERDPRANHFAARARIEEDERNATPAAERKEAEEAVAEAMAEEPPKTDSTTCMKRESSGSKVVVVESSDMAKGDREDGSVKRVRFADDVVFEDARAKDSTFVRPKPLHVAASQVPDHVRNPSKYTRYTLDWSAEDNDDTTNVQALDACYEAIKAKQSKGSDDTDEISERIHFIPRKSARGTVENTEIGDVHHQVSIVHAHKSRMCIDDEREVQNETSMEFDDDDGGTETKIVSSTTASRRYRSKKEIDATDGGLLGSL